jgi:nucleoside-diphosphate-sugar epimerase
MNILIIGGTRFIGPFVVRQLVESGHDVTLFHRGETEARLPETATHIHGDRYHLPEYQSQFNEIRPDIVIDMMIRFGWQAEDLMKIFSGLARRVVMISSVDVYRNMGILRSSETGEIYPDRMTEEAPLRNKLYPYRSEARSPDEWMYEYDKIPAEGAVLSNPKLPGTVLRLPMVYGPGDPQHRLFDYLKRMRDNRPAILLDREHMRARWIRGYVENVASAIVASATDDRAAGKIFNVGEPEALTEDAWVRAIGDTVGWTGEIIGLPHSELPEHLQTSYNFKAHLDVDTSRLRSELGYTEPIAHEEALNRTVSWEMINPPSVIKHEDFNYAAEDAVLSSFKR